MQNYRSICFVLFLSILMTPKVIAVFTVPLRPSLLISRSVVVAAWDERDPTLKWWDPLAPNQYTPNFLYPPNFPQMIQGRIAHLYQWVGQNPFNNGLDVFDL